nr:hypothetical protein Itr_chr01CG08680 [Ipomoea trifida]
MATADRSNSSRRRPGRWSAAAMAISGGGGRLGSNDRRPSSPVVDERLWRWTAAIPQPLTSSLSRRRGSRGATNWREAAASNSGPPSVW